MERPVERGEGLERGERLVWASALGCFVLAALVGTVLRFGLVLGLPDPLVFDHLRHAHSHLMYLGWVTPPLMLLLSHGLRSRGREVEGVVTISAVALAGGVLAFPAFLVAGYSAIEIAGLRMPLSVLAASISGVAWYAFIWRYVRARRGLGGEEALRLWDGAVVMLGLAPLGAMARGLVDATGFGGTEAGLATIAAFLSWFGEGWFVLGVVGLAWAVSPGDERLGRRGRRLVLGGLSVAFLLHLPAAWLPPVLRAGAIAGGLLLAAGLLCLAAALRRSAGPWLVLSTFLGLAAIGRLTATLTDLAVGSAGAGPRILGLHVVTLGVVTLGLIAAARTSWGHTAAVRPAAWTGGVVVLLSALVPASGLLGVPGPRSLVLAAVGSVPLLWVAARDLGRLLKARHQEVGSMSSSVGRSSANGAPSAL